MKYILIMEDNEVYKAERITQDDMDSADDGLMSIIRIEDLKTYFEGEWHDLNEPNY
jgi:hypothetical protein